jgi:hypothetical protein
MLHLHWEPSKIAQDRWSAADIELRSTRSPCFWVTALCDTEIWYGLPELKTVDTNRERFLAAVGKAAENWKEGKAKSIFETIFLKVNVKVNVKFVLEQTTKIQWVSAGIAVLFLQPRR